MVRMDDVIQLIWDAARENVPYANHIMFPSLVAMGSFHFHCWLFTLYDALILKRPGVRNMLYECALPQTIAHGILNALTFYFVTTRTDLPVKAPSAVEFFRDLVLCYGIGDFFIYVEHVYMHKIPFLRHNVHATHHRYTSPMFSFNAGWVHPVEILVAAACELAYPFAVGVHPLTLWVFLWTWIIWLVEEHSGNDVWWSLWNILPLIGCGGPPHGLHHAPHLTKNFGFVFSCWDRMFGTYEEPPEEMAHKKSS